MGSLGNYSYCAGLGTSCNLQRNYVKLRAPFAHSGHLSDLYIIIKFRIGLLVYFAKSHFTATLTLTATYLSGYPKAGRQRAHDFRVCSISRRVLPLKYWSVQIWLRPVSLALTWPLHLLLVGFVLWKFDEIGYWS